MPIELFATDAERTRGPFIDVGDSLNDAPTDLAHSIGAAATCYIDRMATPRRWMTKAGRRSQLVEIADALLAARA